MPTTLSSRRFYSGLPALNFNALQYELFYQKVSEYQIPVSSGFQHHYVRTRTVRPSSLFST
jgi:hypothetical protein